MDTIFPKQDTLIFDAASGSFLVNSGLHRGVGPLWTTSRERATRYSLGTVRHIREALPELARCWSVSA
jgi:hypothetical protein